jgi:phosphonate transport system substrate-binding protein
MHRLKLASCMAENTEDFCHAVAAFVANRLRVSVEYVSGISWQKREHLFDLGEIQILWLCGLPYVDKVDAAEHDVELLAVPVPSGERYQSKPIYFSDVVVRRDRPFRFFQDLRGASWAYNEPHSHSGFNVVRAHLAQSGEQGHFFRAAIESGSHSASLEMILRGQVDAAAIDSTVLEWLAAQRADLTQEIRVIDSLGPSPIPPWVISRGVPEALRQRVRGALLRMHLESFGRVLLQRARLDRFVPAADRDYDPIRAMARKAAEVSFV